MDPPQTVRKYTQYAAQRLVHKSAGTGAYPRKTQQSSVRDVCKLLSPVHSARTDSTQPVEFSRIGALRTFLRRNSTQLVVCYSELVTHVASDSTPFASVGRQVASGSGVKWTQTAPQQSVMSTDHLADGHNKRSPATASSILSCSPLFDHSLYRRVARTVSTSSALPARPRCVVSADN